VSVSTWEGGNLPTQKNHLNHRACESACQLSASLPWIAAVPFITGEFTHSAATNRIMSGQPTDNEHDYQINGGQRSPQ
jgi:hypothetical protein